MRHFMVTTSLLALLSGCGDSEPPNPPAPTPPVAESRPKRSKVAQYQRSPFSNDPMAVGPAVSRPLDDSDPEESARVAALRKRASRDMKKEEALAVISEAQGSATKEVIALAKELARHTDPEVRGSALALAGGFDTPEVLPLVNTALGDEVPDVRLEAVELLRFVKHDSAKPIYKKAILDADPNVRMFAFTSAVEYDDTFKAEILRENVSSPEEDIARSSMAYLEAGLDKSNLDAFMKGLDHASPLVKDQAFERLYFLFDKKFTSTAQAEAWWRQNQANYNEDLVPMK